MIYILILLLALTLIGCGQKEEQKSKVEEAVKEAVTKELKMYEGAKALIEKAGKGEQERREKEKDVQ
jgi:PBP1b-binding outer membrane lipoprotein LpoB